MKVMLEEGGVVVEVVDVICVVVVDVVVVCVVLVVGVEVVVDWDVVVEVEKFVQSLHPWRVQCALALTFALLSSVPALYSYSNVWLF